MHPHQFVYKLSPAQDDKRKQEGSGTKEDPYRWVVVEKAPRDCLARMAPNFNFLQHSKSHAKRICYFIFDLLIYQSRNLMHLLLIGRREILPIGAAIILPNLKRNVRTHSAKARVTPLPENYILASTVTTSVPSARNLRSP